MSNTANRPKSSSGSGQRTDSTSAKPSSESIRLMKLMEGALSKYDDPKAEAKVKALMQAMDSKSSLTEDEVFLALYDHNYDFEETLKALKEAEADADEVDKWTAVEKKKAADTDSAVTSPVPSEGQRGRRRFNGNARQGGRRATGRAAFRRPTGGRVAPRQRGLRSDRGQGRPFTASRPEGQDPNVAEIYYAELEESWDGNLSESQVFTRKFEPSRVPAASQQLSTTTFSSSRGPIGQPGSWADLACSTEQSSPPDTNQDDKEHRTDGDVRSLPLPPVIMPPCSSPVVEDVSFGADCSQPMRVPERQGLHRSQVQAAAGAYTASRLPPLFQPLKEAVFLPYNQRMNNMLIGPQNNVLTTLPIGMQPAYPDQLQTHGNGRTYPQGSRFSGYNMNGQPLSSTTTTSVMPPHLMSVGSAAEQATSNALFDFFAQRLEAAQLQNAFAASKLPGDFSTTTTSLFMPPPNRTLDTTGRNAWLLDNKAELANGSLLQGARRLDDAQMSHAYSLLSQLQGFRSPNQGIFGNGSSPRHAFQSASPRNQQPAAGDSWNV